MVSRCNTGQERPRSSSSLQLRRPQLRGGKARSKIIHQKKLKLLENNSKHCSQDASAPKHHSHTPLQARQNTTRAWYPAPGHPRLLRVFARLQLGVLALRRQRRLEELAKRVPPRDGVRCAAPELRAARPALPRSCGAHTRVCESVARCVSL